MSTPSIQTLITQAQQVLNLKSSNEIRATLAAVLANANVGTPLNPNLTTQQLWDEFYEIVRQPSDDIMSIITDQMMRMVFSPPAPGGAGADKQVIFNDMGVLAGDAGLVYNKTTDALTVAGLVTAGSATITGDLTVATDRLKVVTASTAVQIGSTTQVQVGTTAWPSTAIGKSNARFLVGNEGTIIGWNEAAPVIGNYGTLFIGAKTAIGATTFSGLQLRGGIENASDQAGYCSFWTSPAGGGFLERYKIDSTGISTWSVAGTTAMTLNSTGLGIGASPSFKLDVAGAANSAPITLLRLNNTGTTGGGPGIAAKLQFNAGATSLGFVQGCNFASGSIGVQISGDGKNIHQTIDSSGNVGIGVTPSAWTTYSALQIRNGSIANYSPTQDLRISSNAYYASGVWKRIAAAFASQYLLDGSSGIHQWYVAATGAADSTITTFTSAAMTLDASGNLVLGTTATYNSSRLTVQGASGVGGVVTAIQNNNDSYYAINFRNSSGTSCGSISCTTSLTAFNVSSDYRLKEAVQPLTGGLTRINALKPSIYKWKVNGSTGEGFIAHELADVVPFAVTGDKDAVDADGKPAYQGVDLSKLVPILVAAIQELTARVQTLEAR